MWSLDRHSSLSPLYHPPCLLTTDEKETSRPSHTQTAGEVAFNA